MKKTEMKKTLAVLATLVGNWLVFAAPLTPALDPLIPIPYDTLDINQCTAELRKIRNTTGLRRFFLAGPGFNSVMHGPFDSNLYRKMGDGIGTIKRALSDTDIEISWWCSPSIRYFSDFQPIEDAHGHCSADNKKCPLDPAFAADFAAKIQDVARSHPPIICIEDDYTLSWGRGLKGGACFCRRHLDSFALHFGKPLTAAEINAAFEKRTDDNLAIRRAFACTIRDSLVALAKQVRKAVDEVDPSIRIMVCEPGEGGDVDGVATEAIVRAFAGKTRPMLRPAGAIYGAETTPAQIPPTLARAMWTIEHLPSMIESYYEADVYPHNRFYSSASQLISLMSGALMAGADDFLFHCLQYLDDPLEDRGYVDAYLRLRPRFGTVREFIRGKNARLCGIRTVWTADDLALTRRAGYGHGTDTMSAAMYMLSKFGIPYTTHESYDYPAILIGGVAEVLPDVEIRKLLSGGVLADAPAAEILSRRGYGELLGVEVSPVERLPAAGERLLPAAECTCAGRRMNAFYLFPAGSEGTVERFAMLQPRAGTSILSELTDIRGESLAPAITFATNSLGGKVAVMATSVIRNRTSGLFNLRKQELVQRLFERMPGGCGPLAAIRTPGIWVLASVSQDCREMMVMVNNLSGDDREGLRFSVGRAWRGALVHRIGIDGSEESPVMIKDEWNPTIPFKQMEPEFFLFRLRPENG